MKKYPNQEIYPIFLLNYKMNPNRLEQVVELNQQGMLNKDIAKQLGMEQSAVSVNLKISSLKRNRTYRGFNSPLDYFNEHFKDRNLTRGQLQKEDFSLYHTLRRHGQLNEAIPKQYRNHDSPLDYFKEHFGDRKLIRSQLRKEDDGLYQALRNHKQLDEAIPKE